MTDLILGTAQFGAVYGVTNTVGRISDDELRAILTGSVSSRIRTFDTAADYHDAQVRLGSLMPTDAPVRYVSKFRLPDDGSEPTFEQLIAAPLRALRASTLHALLLHRVGDLRDPRMDMAIDLLREARSQGYVEHMGISAYDREDLRLAIARWPDFDIAQIPASIVDQRLLHDSALRQRHEGGTIIHARSAFLQGLLLANPKALEPRFAALASTIAMLDDVAHELGATRAAVALAFLRHHPLVDAVIVGVTSTSELTSLTADWTAAMEFSPSPIEAPEQLLDPRGW